MIQSQSHQGAPIFQPPILPPAPSVDPYLWQGEQLENSLRNLQDTVDLLKSIRNELSAILSIKTSEKITETIDNVPILDQSENNVRPAASASVSTDDFIKQMDDSMALAKFLEMSRRKRVGLGQQESLAVEAVNSLISTLQSQLAPFNGIMDETNSWVEKSAAVKLANKLMKSKRNKCWKRKRRKHMVEMLLKERQMYDQIDAGADEWRAREIANDIARRKVEKMKTIAKIKAKEERKRLESELELVLMVEKLHELRSIRIQKLKKQGHFLPEEDDKFLERVRAAVEEEERLAAAAADTGAAKDAISTAEDSRKASKSSGNDVNDVNNNKITELEHLPVGEDSMFLLATIAGSEQGISGQDSSGSQDSLGSLPVEFYHYYHGGSTDMGTLIEVRRQWDSFIRPGGSRIPGHWVQPPPPADETWASYLVVRK